MRSKWFSKNAIPYDNFKKFNYQNTDLKQRGHGLRHKRSIMIDIMENIFSYLECRCHSNAFTYVFPGFLH